MVVNISIDEIDLKIIIELSNNSRVPLSTISKHVNLSIPAISERIKKLEKNGYIEKYSTQLNPKKFNKNIICFSMLTLRYDEQELDSFFDFVKKEKDILECHLITGEYEYLLKIITDAPETLEKLLSSLRKKAKILTSSTSISLSTIKNNTSFY